MIHHEIPQPSITLYTATKVYSRRFEKNERDIYLGLFLIIRTVNKIEMGMAGLISRLDSPKFRNQNNFESFIDSEILWRVAKELKLPYFVNHSNT